MQQIVDMTGGFGADYTFEATGNVGVMRQAVESARMGWGLATVCGVAGRGETLDVVPRFLITGRRVAGSSFGGVKGATRCRSSSTSSSPATSTSTRSISHQLTLDDVNRGFELMEAQDGIRSVIGVRLDSVGDRDRAAPEEPHGRRRLRVAKKQRLRTRNGAASSHSSSSTRAGAFRRESGTTSSSSTRFAEGDAVRVLGRVEQFRDRLQLEFARSNRGGS